MPSPGASTVMLLTTGTAVDRAADPAGALDPFALMGVALDQALEAAGPRHHALLDGLGEVIVMEGTWKAKDPARLVLGDRVARAHRVVATVGVLQQTVLSRAAAAIRDGRCEVVVVLGGEAKWRDLRARVLGVELPPIEEAEAAGPDLRLVPEGQIINSIEIERHLAVPAHQYALMQSALGHKLRRSPEDEVTAVSELVASMARVAAGNPERWVEATPSAADIRAARPVAWPYTKPCCSQWNVDQAAALIFCSAEFADRHGLDTSSAVYPVVAVESNYVVPLTEREDLADWPTASVIGEAIAGAWGRPLSDVDLVELYSCFPSAVELQRRGLALDPRQPVTVTGGMPFAGGPFNSSTLQALARVAGLLRHGAGGTALVTSVSGMLSKGGAAIWSATEPASPFVDLEVSEEVAAVSPRRQVDGSITGPVTVVGWTVVAADSGPTTVAVGERADGVRTVASSADQHLAEGMLDGTDWVGHTAEVDGSQLLHITP